MKEIDEKVDVPVNQGIIMQSCTAVIVTVSEGHGQGPSGEGSSHSPTPSGLFLAYEEAVVPETSLSPSG